MWSLWLWSGWRSQDSLWTRRTACHIKIKERNCADISSRALEANKHGCTWKLDKRTPCEKNLGKKERTTGAEDTQNQHYQRVRTVVDKMHKKLKWRDGQGKRQNVTLASTQKTRTYRAVGRPRKRWEDEVNDILRLGETEETRGNDTRNNDTWIKIAKDQKKLEANGKRICNGCRSITGSTETPRKSSSSTWRHFEGRLVGSGGLMNIIK